MEGSHEGQPVAENGGERVRELVAFVALFPKDFVQLNSGGLVTVAHLCLNNRPCGGRHL